MRACNYTLRWHPSSRDRRRDDESPNELQKLGTRPNVHNGRNSLTVPRDRGKHGRLFPFAPSAPKGAPSPKSTRAGLSLQPRAHARACFKRRAWGRIFSYPVFRQLQKLQTTFVGLAGTRSASANLSFNNSSAQGLALMVSGNYFGLLGVNAAIGRVLTEADDNVMSGSPVLVLSHAYWLSRFGGDSSILKQTLIVNGYPMTIVGVADKGFLGEKPGASPDIFVPITMKRELSPGWDGFRDRRDYWVTLLGRLKSNVTLQEAEAEINHVYHAQLEEDVVLLANPSASFLAQFRAKKILLKPGEYGRGDLRDKSRQPGLLAMGLSMLILIIACGNVANLQLARALSRGRDVAMRLALGGSRWQVTRQFILEALMLSIGGGAIGIGLAYWITQGLIANQFFGNSYTHVFSSRLSFETLAFCFAIAIISAVLFGMLPALQGTRMELASSLKEQSGQSTSTHSAGLARKGLVTVQIAISLTLLVCSGLLLRTLSNLRKIDLGIRIDHLLRFSLSPKLNRYTDQRASELYDQLRSRVAEIPGVRSVSTGINAAVSGSSFSGNIEIDAYHPATADTANVNYDAVGPGYFRTMGIALIMGRDFSDTDNVNSPKVGIVNEALSEHSFQTKTRSDIDFSLDRAVTVRTSASSVLPKTPRMVTSVRMPRLYITCPIDRGLLKTSFTFMFGPRSSPKTSCR